jgi:hypothetical protein
MARDFSLNGERSSYSLHTLQMFPTSVSNEFDGMVDGVESSTHARYFQGRYYARDLSKGVHACMGKFSRPIF